MTGSLTCQVILSAKTLRARNRTALRFVSDIYNVALDK